MSGSTDEPTPTDPPEAFYERAGDGFEATVLTRGPWDGGEPARGASRCAARA